MKVLIDNFAIVVALLALFAMALSLAYAFIKEPKDKKIANVREWLLYAVTEAEKQFGSGTGTLKLHYVYNLAVDKFPWLPELITFDVFSKWVDEALIWLQVQLESNKKVKDYVEDSTR